MDPIEAAYKTGMIVSFVLFIIAIMFLAQDAALPNNAHDSSFVHKKVYSVNTGKYLFTGAQVGLCGLPESPGLLFKEVSGPLFGRQLKKTSLCVPAQSILWIEVNDPNVFHEGDLR